MVTWYRFILLVVVAPTSALAGGLNEDKVQLDSSLFLLAPSAAGCVCSLVFGTFPLIS